MTFAYRPAVRQNVPLLLSLAGASGSGKTMSAMLLAKGLAGGEPFHVLDTENGRALAYADHFDFLHGDLHAPFSPDRYADAIEEADQAGAKVIVVDSFSHEHAGEGGLLDMQEAELDRMAGDDWKKRDAMKMSSWIQPKRKHKAMINRLLQVQAHVIVCLRAEERIEIVKDPQTGKTKVQPKKSLVGLDGWVPVSEKNLPYEMTASFLLTPAAPGVPKPIKLNGDHCAFFPVDRPITEEAGARLREWASGAAADDAHSPSLEPAGLSMPALKAWIADNEADTDQLVEIAKRLFPDGSGFKSLSDVQRLAVRDAYVSELQRV